MYIIWLVFSTPLKNMKINWDDSCKYMEKQKSCSKPLTRYVYIYISHDIPTVSERLGTPLHSQRLPNTSPSSASKAWRQAKMQSCDGLLERYQPTETQKPEANKTQIVDDYSGL